MSRRALWIFFTVLGAGMLVGGGAGVFWFSRRVGELLLSGCSCAWDFFRVHPIFTLCLGSTVAAAGAIFLRAVGKVCFALWATRRRERRFRAAASASLANHTFLVDVSEHVACTIGLRQPRTYVSTSVWNLLSPAARDALLAHEGAHRAHADPALRLVLLFADALIGWIPGVRRCLAAEEVYSEVRADAVAENARGRAAVREAMERLVLPPAARVLVAAGFVSLDDRVFFAARTGMFAHIRRQGMRLAACSVIALTLLVFGMRGWAAEQPQGQCLLARPVCTARLPHTSLLPVPVSTPTSIPSLFAR